MRGKCSSIPRQHKPLFLHAPASDRGCLPCSERTYFPPPSPQINSISSCPSTSFLLRLITLCTPMFDDLLSKPGTMIRNSAFPLALSPEAQKFSGKDLHPGTAMGRSVPPQKVCVGHQRPVVICDAATQSAEEDVLLSSHYC